MIIKPSKDVNGNTTVKVTFEDNTRGFSVQTNGNMPLTHRAITWEGGFNTSQAISELHGFIKVHGSARQKDLLGWY